MSARTSATSSTTGATTMKRIKVEQTGSPQRRHHTQRETLIGLGLNKIGRVKALADAAREGGLEF